MTWGVGRYQLRLLRQLVDLETESGEGVAGGGPADEARWRAVTAELGWRIAASLAERRGQEAAARRAAHALADRGLVEVRVECEQVGEQRPSMRETLQLRLTSAGWDYLDDRGLIYVMDEFPRWLQPRGVLDMWGGL
ncbi:hypothetical protein OHB26_38680 (plasmid) [Nocardia sp. NBC_01503]|uniref:hypothetical protein n=1 Tax=Nocardia sp. NBC_01503 TaxID=2975997 RepID=UPI002E7AF91E|nr:hypothetical protein [Nocardia sp. NBC_01503]WTL36604.1 hypothetical protein OHB26_38680 [Nocardia sp. NBC_01503]